MNQNLDTIFDDGAQFLKTRAEIEAWLNQVRIKNYEIIEDTTLGLMVNVHGLVALHGYYMEKLPVRFNEIKGNCGHFQCPGLGLVTLNGAPRRVEGSFNCSHNKLNSLKGGPEIVIKDYNCSNNNLTSLEGCAKEVGERLYFDYNDVQDLAFFPDKLKMVSFFKNMKIDNINSLNDLYEKHRSDKIIYEKYILTRKINVIENSQHKAVKI